MRIIIDNTGKEWLIDGDKLYNSDGEPHIHQDIIDKESVKVEKTVKTGIYKPRPKPVAYKATLKIYKYKGQTRITKGYDRTDHYWKQNFQLSKSYYDYLESKDNLIQFFDSLVNGYTVQDDSKIEVDTMFDSLVIEADKEIASHGFRNSVYESLVEGWDEVQIMEVLPYVKISEDQEKFLDFD